MGITDKVFYAVATAMLMLVGYVVGRVLALVVG